jgi:allophanate hydrolase
VSGPVAAIVEAVRGGRCSALEAAREALAAAAAYDAIQPQTWIARRPDDEVLAAARAVDDRLAAGERLPLAGATFAIKDNIDLAGLATTAACPAFAYAPAADAPVVARLIAAGAVPIGKTNLDQFATGLTGARSPHGALGCVFNREFISGGSSSGSAVAVAAGLVAFALGTDTAGSGRVPAAFNGLTGLKPTRGRWSTRGVVPACRSLDCVSLFTTDAADAALIDAELAGVDPGDPYSRPVGPPAAATGVLGVPRTLDGLADPRLQRLFEVATWRAQAAGARLVEVDIAPLIACGRLLYEGPWIAERWAALGPFLRAHPGAVHPVVRALIQGGAGISAAQAFDGFHALKAHEQAAIALWTQVDALLLPTAPTAYRIGEVLAEPFALNAQLGLYAHFVNLLDMAAVAAPAGFVDTGVGFGVSLIGPAWSEARLLALAERIADPAPPPPLDLAGRAPGVKLAVVGAHLAGMPLHWQLAARHARLVRACRTAPAYRLYAMAGSSPPKPALVHVGAGGAAIAVEVYEIGLAEFGGFVAEVPPPLAIGTVTLDDGESVKGFVAEPRATEGAADITHLGGWRAFMAQGGGL